MFKCLRKCEEGVLIYLHVVPNSKKEEVTYNEWDGRLHINIREPPRGGEANERIVEFFSILFGNCNIVSGKPSRKKTIRIKDVSVEHVREKLREIL